MRKFIIAAFAAALTFAGCDVLKQVGGALNMVNCEYDYNSISQLSLSGMNLSDGVSLAYIPKITSILTGTASSIPLDFTLNLDVKNPNQTAAMLSGLQYILNIDGVDFTTGALNRALNIPAGGTQVMPVKIGVDLKTLLKGESKDAVVGIAKNFIGIGDKASKVSLKIKPSFKVGSQTVTAPSYIPVNFTFGGKKK